MDSIEQIIEIIADTMNLDETKRAQFTADTDLVNQLHVDSLDMVLIVGEIEERFDVSIDVENIAGIRTARDIDEKVKSLKN